MCGISGIYGITDQHLAADAVTKMNRALSHRGPDDEGVYPGRGVTLGHRRLSIIDLSPAGHQPMLSADGRYVVVHNGEIYNYREVREQIKEYPFKTNTDTEVILAAFSKWGAECLQRFNGMFSFAIWDTDKEKLFIARDRLGVKPLYYYNDNEKFLFASEIRALLASGIVSPQLCRSGLDDFFRYQTVHAPYTILKDIYVLEPGHYLTVSKRRIEVTPYWSLKEKFNSEIAGKPYSEICSDIEKLFYDAVKLRLVADVPLGAFLSGGMDSSSVVGAMSSLMDRPVRTFSIVFKEKKFSESGYAAQAARIFKTDHREIVISPGQILSELPEALRAMDHPTGDGVNTWFVSRATKEAGVTTALSGLGSDELFGGYPLFRRIARLEKNSWINIFPSGARSLAAKILREAGKGAVNIKAGEILVQPGDLNFEAVYPTLRQVFLDGEISWLQKKSELTPNQVAAKLGLPGSGFGKNHLYSEISLAELSGYMQNVLLRDTDQMSMAHALEVRTPFLDYRLAEYLISVPDRHKNSKYPKQLLADALQLLPGELVQRPKMGFVFPWEQWLKNELRTFCQDRLQKLADEQIVEPVVMNRMWNDFLAGNTKIRWVKFWMLTALSDWMTTNNVRS